MAFQDKTLEAVVGRNPQYTTGALMAYMEPGVLRRARTEQSPAEQASGARTARLQKQGAMDSMVPNQGVQPSGRGGDPQPAPEGLNSPALQRGGKGQSNVQGAAQEYLQARARRFMDAQASRENEMAVLLQPQKERAAQLAADQKIQELQAQSIGDLYKAATLSPELAGRMVDENMRWLGGKTKGTKVKWEGPDDDPYLALYTKHPETGEEVPMAFGGSPIRFKRSVLAEQYGKPQEWVELGDGAGIMETRTGEVRPVAGGGRLRERVTTDYGLGTDLPEPNAAVLANMHTVLTQHAMKEYGLDEERAYMTAGGLLRQLQAQTEGDLGQMEALISREVGAAQPSPVPPAAQPGLNAAPAAPATRPSPSVPPATPAAQPSLDAAPRQDPRVRTSPAPENVDPAGPERGRAMEAFRAADVALTQAGLNTTLLGRPADRDRLAMAMSQLATFRQYLGPREQRQADDLLRRIQARLERLPRAE